MKEEKPWLLQIAWRSCLEEKVKRQGVHQGYRGAPAGREGLK
jgi:hypothetical protein